VAEDHLTRDAREAPDAPIAARVTAEHPSRTTAEQAALALGDAPPMRATPGAGRAVSVRGTRAGLRLYGVATVDATAHALPLSLAVDTELVVYRDVGAVVEAAPYAPDPLGTVALERHHQVVSEVFARRTIVPAPPGTVFRSRDALAGWLELHYFTLVGALGFLEDRVAARVTVTRAGDVVSRAAPLDLDAGALTEELHAPDALVAEAAEPFAALRRDAVSLLVLRADEMGEAAAAYASFLVEAARWPQFEQAVAREEQLRPTMRLQVSGPWPPYDFVRLQFRG
jgi:hypothetical protein